jgi:hypothetical protein
VNDSGVLALFHFHFLETRLEFEQPSSKEERLERRRGRPTPHGLRPELRSHAAPAYPGTANGAPTTNACQGCPFCAAFHFLRATPTERSPSEWSAPMLLRSVTGASLVCAHADGAAAARIGRLGAVHVAGADEGAG